MVIKRNTVACGAFAIQHLDLFVRSHWGLFSMRVSGSVKPRPHNTAPVAVVQINVVNRHLLLGYCIQQPSSSHRHCLGLGIRTQTAPSCLAVGGSISHCTTCSCVRSPSHSLSLPEGRMIFFFFATLIFHHFDLAIEPVEYCWLEYCWILLHQARRILPPTCKHFLHFSMRLQVDFMSFSASKEFKSLQYLICAYLLSF